MKNCAGYRVIVKKERECGIRIPPIQTLMKLRIAIMVIERKV